MQNSLIKKIALFAIIFGMIFVVTACTDSNPFSDGGRLHQKDVQVTIRPEGDVSSVNTDSEINESSFRVLPGGDAELRLNSNSVNVDNGEIKVEGTLMNIRGDMTLRINHSEYGSSNSRSITYNSSEPISFIIDPTVDEDDGNDENGDSDDGSDDGDDPQEIEDGLEVDVNVKKTHEINNISFYEIDFLDYAQLDAASKVYVDVKHLDDDYGEFIIDISELKSDDTLHVESEKDNDEEPRIDIALLDSDNRQMARANNWLVNESQDTIIFDSEVDDIEITNTSVSNNDVSIQSDSYLAEHSINIDKLESKSFEKWLIFKLPEGTDEDFTSNFLTINNKGIDLSFDFSESEITDDFIDVFNREHELSGGQVENMELYYKLKGRPMRNAHDQAAVENEDDVLSLVTEVYLDDEDSNDLPPYAIASAEVSYRYETFYDNDESDQVHLYTINVQQFEEGIAGLPEAKSFTVGDPGNDSREFGTPLEITSNEQLSELPVYILGMSADDLEGEGTIDNPFKISTPEQLNQVLRYNVSNDKIYYTLNADINMEDFDGWQPVGSESRSFQGNLDGQDYEISNLGVDVSGRAGLFGNIGSEGVVENIILRNFNVSGTRYVGAIAGRNQGKIRNIRMLTDESTIYGQGQYVGGLVGQNFSSSGIIEDSETRGDVSSDGEYVGGLAGANTDATINDSLSEATVSGIEAVGGLVGWNNSNGIHGSIARGDVSGETRIGGLVGLNDGLIEGSGYENGSVDGEGYYIGGLVGINNNPDGKISEESFVENATINGWNSVGGITGINRAEIIDTSVLLSNVTGEDNNVGGLVGDNREDADLRYSDFLQGSVTGRYNVGGLAGRNAANRSGSGIYHNNVHVENQISGVRRYSRFIGYNLPDAKYGNNGGIAYFEIKDIRPENGRFLIDREETIEVDVENIGDRTGTKEIYMTTPNDEFNITESIELGGGGDTGTVTFSFKPENMGDYNVDFVVEDNDDEDSSTFKVLSELSDEAGMTSLDVSWNDNSSSFTDFDTGEVSVEEVEYDVDEITLVLSLNDEDYAKWEIDNDESNEEYKSGEEALVKLDDIKTEDVEGDTTTIKIKVTAEDGNTTSELDVIVVQDPDPNVPKVDVSASQVSPNSAETWDKTDYTFDVKLTGLSDVNGNDNFVNIYVKDSEDNIIEDISEGFDNPNDDTSTVSITREDISFNDPGEYEVIVESVELKGAEDIEEPVNVDIINISQKELSIEGDVELGTGDWSSVFSGDNILEIYVELNNGTESRFTNKIIFDKIDEIKKTFKFEDNLEPSSVSEEDYKIGVNFGNRNSEDFNISTISGTGISKDENGGYVVELGTDDIKDIEIIIEYSPSD